MIGGGAIAAVVLTVRSLVQFGVCVSSFLFLSPPLLRVVYLMRGEKEELTLNIEGERV
ncbi:hypothetical protein TSUD_70230 [Trifolium subterraneum]|uniref:Uncharacterized protein n=1 Tax=Trifolium subterraneum TaxID=3900 RepID=A0A2Z6MPB1_TRISU|nr:hypothetical protein TSUD_70230 [Trifolium subterraneum]